MNVSKKRTSAEERFRQQTTSRSLQRHPSVTVEDWSAYDRESRHQSAKRSAFPFCHKTLFFSHTVTTLETLALPTQRPCAFSALTSTWLQATNAIDDRLGYEIDGAGSLRVEEIRPSAKIQNTPSSCFCGMKLLVKQLFIKI
ncbi:hypothetical protein ZHAS_00018343 [Anopheles sinensis]|uniref:Uncharacterized protein n=1 Tax=Anopheles sinensis TaxID=74873 RepID=A0A084WJ71_ANOSI|nr:hypothetical protein ZHAS_00018343 [Anopheles sinensis]